MPDPTVPELVSQAKRVVGMFVAMIGSGIVLESAALWTGIGIMLVGLGLMIWGLAESRRLPSWYPRESESEPAAGQRAPESAP